MHASDNGMHQQYLPGATTCNMSKSNHIRLRTPTAARNDL